MLTAVAAVAGPVAEEEAAAAEEAVVEAARRRNQRPSKHQRCYRQRPSENQCRRLQVL